MASSGVMALSVLDEAMAYLNNFCRLDTHLKTL